MEKQELFDKVERFAGLAKKELPVKKILLFGAWLEGLAKENHEIEVAVVVDKVEDDYLEVQMKLEQLGYSVDSRIEPILFESEKQEKVDFLNEVLENGKIIYEE
ncbi:MAG: hypothetical protein GY950_05385 [bacterium]|nr:hypothetical protein [bacterium]